MVQTTIRVSANTENHLDFLENFIGSNTDNMEELLKSRNRLQPHCLTSFHSLFRLLEMPSQMKDFDLKSILLLNRMSSSRAAVLTVWSADPWGPKTVLGGQ